MRTLTCGNIRYNMDAVLYYLCPVFLAVVAWVFYLFYHDIKVPSLHNKCVVITGCDTGFGHQLAINLDALGLCVFAGCFTEKGEHELAAKCSHRLQTVRMDVTKEEDIQKCFECVKSYLETKDNTVLWAVVNNAGIDIPGLVDWSSIEDMKKVFDVNLWGVLAVTKAFLPLLKKSKGRIVNIASAGGKVAVPVSGAYSGSKYSIQCYCDILRRELFHFGVTVHIIDPGFFKTNLTDAKARVRLYQRVWDSISPEMQEEYGQEYFDHVVDVTGKTLQFCQDMKPVIQAMEHAVTSTRPKLRYIVGWDHKLLWRWVAFLPSGLQDLIFRPLIPVPKAALN